MTLAVGIVGVGLIGQDHARRLSGLVAAAIAEAALAARASGQRVPVVLSDRPG